MSEDSTPIVHLRNGQAERHPQTRGEGVTWCGKKLIGSAEKTDDAVEFFTSYGSKVFVTFDPDGGSCARCKEAFEAAYSAAFPDGLKPIATFRLDNPDDMARAKSILSPEALNGFFGPGGGGIAAFTAALRAGGEV